MRPVSEILATCNPNNGKSMYSLSTVWLHLKKMKEQKAEKWNGGGLLEEKWSSETHTENWGGGKSTKAWWAQDSARRYVTQPKRTLYTSQSM